MHARVRETLIALLNTRIKLDKETAAELVHCDAKTAQRVLSILHAEKCIRIAGWIVSKGAYYQEYILQDGKPDSKKVAIRTHDKTKYQAERRKDPAVRLRELTAQRIRNVVENPRIVRIGFWGV